MKLMSPLQEQAHSVLTRFSFQEFERFAQYSIDNENGNVFVFRFYKEVNSREHVVFWDVKVGTCNCKLFEFWGILCHHILSIFLHKDIHVILTIFHHGGYFNHHLMILRGSHKLMLSLRNKEKVIDCNNKAHSQHVVHCPPKAKPKCRPTRPRLKGGKKLSHNMNTCGSCKGVGWNTLEPHIQYLNNNSIVIHISSRCYFIINPKHA